MRAIIILVALMLTTPAAARTADDCASGHTTQGLPDHRSTGDRVVQPCWAFGGVAKDFELAQQPAWVVAHPGRPGNRWILTTPDGTVLEFRQGETTPIGQLPPGEAPVVARHQGEFVIYERSRSGVTDDPIPGARWVSGGTIAALPAGPTDRYAHGVLGDEIEAASLLIWTDHSSIRTVELPQDEVIEGISAIATQFGDTFGFLVTVSDAEQGARLRAYDEYGQVIAESAPIGRGFRWMHQIGVGPTGPAGEVEVIAVRTPHIGGVVEAYQLTGDRFERVAAVEGYSSHVIGSANLDMALLADTDADGQLEIIVPTQAMTELAVLERTSEGFEELMQLPLDGRLASNIAAAVGRDGRLSLAVATDDGRLRIFR